MVNVFGPTEYRGDSVRQGCIIAAHIALPPQGQ
jgi:hypothetical protein